MVGGPLVAFADSELFYLNPAVPQELVGVLLTANGGETDGWLR